MALDNAALLEVLEAMQAAGVEDRVRTAAQTIYQALIDAELSAVIGAGPWERTDARTAQRNGFRPRFSRRPRATCGCRSRSCGRGRSSRRCWNGAAGSTRPCSRW